MSEESTYEFRPNVVNFVDNRLNMITKPKLGTRLGYQVNSWIQHDPAESSALSNGCSRSWNIVMSSGTLTDDSVQLHANVSVAYTVTTGKSANEEYAEFTSKWGFNSLPISSAISVANVKINSNVPMSTNVSELVPVILYSSNEKELRDISVYSAPDTQFAFNSSVITDPLRSALDSFGWSRGLGQGRLSSVVYDDTADTLTMTFDIYEKLIARPFSFSSEPKSVVGVNSLNLSLKMESDLYTSMVCNASGNTLSAFTFNSLKLITHQYTPHALTKLEGENEAYWNTPTYDLFMSSSTTLAKATKSTTDIAPSTSSFVDTSVRPFTTIPKALCIYAEEARADATVPRRLYPMSSIKVMFGEKKNIGLDFNQEDWYRISKANGYNGSPYQFFGVNVANATSTIKRGTGAMVIITPSDLDTKEFLQSNVLTNINIQVSATIQNPDDTATHNVYLKCMAITDAYLAYQNGIFREESASINATDLVAGEQMFLKAQIDNLVLGGSEGGSVWTWLRDKVVKPVSKWVRKSDKPAEWLGNIDPRLGKAFKTAQSLTNKLVGERLDKMGYGVIEGRGVVESGGNIIQTGGKNVGKAELFKKLA